MTDRVKARNKKRLLVAFVFWLVGASGANAQSPASLFRQRPAPVQPGAHGTSAHSADVDTGMLMTGPDKLWLVIPGRPDLLVERDSHQTRGARRGVWRGRAQFEPNSRVIITYHDGMVAGHIQLGKDSYAIHPRTGGRIVLEKNNPDSFKPEWGHEHATHGRDKVPPAGTQGGESGSGSTSATTTSASSVNSTADAANEIRLLSVYTPQARAAAGGTTQIEAKIQAAVDQANTAFIDSNMTARFILGHMQEVAYNDTGNIETDLNWVTGNSSVASLRNTHGADMVSLIVANGGSYCGIAWVQRNPGSGFANYAFQVTDSDCLANHTFAHEHGHNMGFEHNPENSSVGKNPSQASYDWSFGHWVNGQFRTVMSYNACSSTCPRLLQFSNPDIAVNGTSTGILNQRDNAQTGDLTAPIIANFRSGGSTTNSPPTFTSDPIVKANGALGIAYSGTIAENASDPNGDPLMFAKTGGPGWLNVGSNGALSGTPNQSGTNSFTVSVTDGRGGSDSTTLQIQIVSQPSAPAGLTANVISSSRIDISWSDTSNNEENFRIERSTDGVNYSPLATVGANVTGYSNTALSSGTTYYYRVYAANVAGNSTFSNTASGTTPAAAPSAPANLTANALVDGKGRNKSYAGIVEVNWSDTSSNETKFVIERCDNVASSGKGRNRSVVCSGSWSTKSTLGANATLYADSSALPNKTYLYRAKAINGVGSSAYSNEAAVTTP